MAEHVGQVNLDFIVRVAEDPEWALSELKQVEAYNTENGALYEGKAVPVPIKPHFISETQRAMMRRAVTRLNSALNRFADIWLASDELQRMWGVSKEELELYKLDPGYPGAIQVARFDGFLEGMDLKFLEFNCDSPGGPGYGDVIHEAFVKLYGRNPKLDKGYQLSVRDRIDQLKETLLTCYAAWRANGHADRPEDPFTVVTDWPDVGSRPDIDICIERLERRGMDVVFADPRDLECRDGELFYQDRRVDLVYKRVIVKELVEEPKAAALAQAYRAGTICMVNSPRSVIVGNKKTLAAIRLPEVMDQLTPDERAAVRKYVPWTEILRDDRVDLNGFSVPLKDIVLHNKDLLVLKAAQSYGGKDVVLGFETEQDKWEALVDQHIHANTWVVQELVPIPKELFPRFEANDLEMELLNVNINPLVFGGNYAGAYTRISKKNVINVSYGGGITPTITVLDAGESD